MSVIAITDVIRVLLIITLVVLAYIDLRTFRLPDIITLPLIIAGLSFSGFSVHHFATLQDSMIGALVGYGFLWLLNYFYSLIKKQNGIGLGDAKLLSALGAWFGWFSLPGILFVASISGLLGGLIWLQWNKKSYRQAFPFGPFLAFAGIMELLWPQFLQNLILSNPT